LEVSKRGKGISKEKPASGEHVFNGAVLQSLLASKYYVR